MIWATSIKVSTQGLDCNEISVFSYHQRNTVQFSSEIRMLVVYELFYISPRFKTNLSLPIL